MIFRGINIFIIKIHDMLFQGLLSNVWYEGLNSHTFYKVLV